MSGRVVKRPLVTVGGFGYSTAGHVMWTAECQHCNWQYRNVAKSDVEWHARLHRQAHRDGTAEVTR